MECKNGWIEWIWIKNLNIQHNTYDKQKYKQEYKDGWVDVPTCRLQITIFFHTYPPCAPNPLI